MLGATGIRGDDSDDPTRMMMVSAYALKADINISTAEKFRLLVRHAFSGVALC